MRILQGLGAVDPPLKGSVLTIGNFDGVHRAHQQLLAQAGLFAANTGGPVVVLTFEPHPLSVVAPSKTPEPLTTLEQKLGYLEEAGADVTVVALSEPDLLGLTAEEFIEQVIRARFQPTHIVEGPSFGFGRGRRGTPELLQQKARAFGCDVHILEPVTLQIDEGETLLVTSSLVRKLLSEGKVHRAALCLGRDYVLLGTVERGAGRGRALGFPTANVSVDQQLIPGDGVYAGRAIVDDAAYAAAISVGMTPTFDGGTRQVEAHLLDFEEDLYDRPIGVEFGRRLRDQRKFDSPDALIEQVNLDVAAVREAAETRQRSARREAGQTR